MIQVTPQQFKDTQAACGDGGSMSIQETQEHLAARYLYRRVKEVWGNIHPSMYPGYANQYVVGTAPHVCCAIGMMLNSDSRKEFLSGRLRVHNYHSIMGAFLNPQKFLREEFCAVSDKFLTDVQNGFDMASSTEDIVYHFRMFLTEYAEQRGWKHPEEALNGKTD